MLLWMDGWMDGRTDGSVQAQASVIETLWDAAESPLLLAGGPFAGKATNPPLVCVCALGPCVVFSLASDHHQLTPQCVTWETYCFNSDKDQPVWQLWDSYLIRWKQKQTHATFAKDSFGCRFTGFIQLALHHNRSLNFAFMLQCSLLLLDSCSNSFTVLAFLFQHVFFASGLVFRIFLSAVFLQQLNPSGLKQRLFAAQQRHPKKRLCACCVVPDPWLKPSGGTVCSLATSFATMVGWENGLLKSTTKYATRKMISMHAKSTKKTIRRGGNEEQPACASQNHTLKLFHTSIPGSGKGLDGGFLIQKYKVSRARKTMLFIRGKCHTCCSLHLNAEEKPADKAPVVWTKNRTFRSGCHLS